VLQDDKQAVFWYQKAADQGLASAEFNLGVCYEKGQGISQDFSQAVLWYQKAAHQGHTGARTALKRLEH
jgi:TPR repeat protein